LGLPRRVSARIAQPSPRRAGPAPQQTARPEHRGGPGEARVACGGPDLGRQQPARFLDRYL